MTSLLIGSNNPGKIGEYRALLAPYAVACVTPRELGIHEDAPEDAETFEENSLLKANFYWQRTHLPTIADDAGLEVDVLGGEPGVHTRRWNGRWMTDEEIRSELLKRLAPFPKERWVARLRSVITLRVSDAMNFQGVGVLNGTIRESSAPMLPGFPVETVLWIAEYNKLYGDLTTEERQKVSNRAHAFRQIVPYLSQYVL